MDYQLRQACDLQEPLALLYDIQYSKKIDTYPVMLGACEKRFVYSCVLIDMMRSRTLATKEVHLRIV